MIVQINKKYTCIGALMMFLLLASCWSSPSDSILLLVKRQGKKINKRNQIYTHISLNLSTSDQRLVKNLEQTSVICLKHNKNIHDK